MTHKHFVNNDGIGYVALLDTMPRENLDEAIVSAARVSYDPGSTNRTRTTSGLIRFLLRHAHTTPFEMVEFKFLIRMPLFIARQHMRHRTSSINEVSARYSEVKDEFFVPEEFRKQATVNRQGSEGVIDDNETMIGATNAHSVMSHKLYMELIKSGDVCREQARMVLPQSAYTEFYWKINLHNLMHYLHLRMDSHAQKEIRDYANTIYNIIKPLAPITCQAFEDFRLKSINLSGPEIKVLTKMLQNAPDADTSELSAGEAREFKDKINNIINV